MKRLIAEKLAELDLHKVVMNGTWGINVYNTNLAILFSIQIHQ